MQLHFQSYGQGPPLVILHGLLGSLENWQPMSRRLGAHFTVYAVDQRNHGRSPHSHAMTYPLMAADLNEFVEGHRLGNIHLLGHSMGGKTAMQFALLYPGKVRKLVVADIAPRAYSPRHERTLAAMLALPLDSFENRKQMEEALAPDVPDLPTRRFLLKNVMREAGGGFHWKNGLREIHQNCGYLSAALSGGHPFAGPALFLRGEWSDYLRVQDLDLIRTLFPKGDLRTVPQTGHLLHSENPEAFFQMALEFLGPALVRI
jgi:pimeloyl-ACP methyl ester carboxylesterase